MIAAVLLGAAMRFYRLGAFPPGLYHDEAINGLDALRVLEGERPVFFEANNGREPFFLYSQALSLLVLGRTPFAVRLPAAILGTLVIPATFLMARALFGRRVGAWSAALIAVAPWPVNLSRIGLRAISMPFVVALALWLWWEGRSKDGWQRAWRLSLGGALLGLSLYTYTAARFVIVAVGLFALFQAWADRKRSWHWEFVYLAVAAFLAMAPLLVYGITHWNVFVERPAQVSIFSPEINHGHPLGMLARNVLAAAGLFTFRGDRILRHNVPLRPLFDPLISVFFGMGALLSLWKARRSGAHALALLWTGVMLVPTIMAEDCPHFLRAVGVLPLAAVFPALGLEWAAGRLEGRGLRWAGGVVLGTALAASAGWGAYDYWVRYARNPDLAYRFEADQVQEAVEINQFLGTGWQGNGLYEPGGEPIPDRHVYLAPRMWEDRFSVNFLVASTDRTSILGRDPPVPADTVLVLAWPHEDMSGVRQHLPHPAQIEVWRGPLEKGDLDAEATLLYVAFRGTRLTARPEAAARFEQGIELLDWDVAPEGEAQTRLRLRWRAGESLSTSYTVFVHLMHGDQVVAQADSAPANGFYPTMWWEPGDVIADDHLIDAPYDPQEERIIVGWYELGSMRRLCVFTKEGQLGEDRLVLE